MKHDRMLAEKILTALYPRLCDQCKALIRETIINLGMESAEEVMSDLGINL